MKQNGLTAVDMDKMRITEFEIGTEQVRDSFVIMWQLP